MASPRFESDKEDDSKARERQRVTDMLKATESFKASGADAEKKSLEGRKANRGFTMSVGSVAKAEAASPPVRGDRRAQTLPASNTRRGDVTFDAKALESLESMQKTMVNRVRRGSLVQAVAKSVVTDQELEASLTSNTRYHSHGLMTAGQAHGDERDRVHWGAAEVPLEPAPVIACQKGAKGFKDSSPNQDNFSVTVFRSGWTLACAFDGHGPFGHIVSTRAVQTVPYFLINNFGFDQPKLDEGSFQEALITAFETAQKDLVAHSIQEAWDIQASGSTAVAALWKGNKVWTANAGDSRCAVGTETLKKVVFETEDHKPTTEGEKKRIEDNGGEVRSQTYPDGWVNHRIFIKGEDYPGLCMARTLGDQSVKEHGVVATPEVAETTVDLGNKPFFILASDGVWEFLTSEFVIKAVAKKIQSDGPAKTVEKLQREARKRWKQEEGDYCDDITSILVQLR